MLIEEFREDINRASEAASMLAFEVEAEKHRLPHQLEEQFMQRYKEVFGTTGSGVGVGSDNKKVPRLRRKRTEANGGAVAKELNRHVADSAVPHCTPPHTVV